MDSYLQVVTDKVRAYRELDPISNYNYVIKHYSDDVNKTTGTNLRFARSNKLFRRWYRFMTTQYIALILLYFIPYVNIGTLVLNTWVVATYYMALGTYY